MQKQGILFLGAFAAVLTSQAFQGYGDLQFVVGNGTHQAGLILDFNDGAGVDSYAWGYRWDGSASGAQMLIDVAAADPLLNLDFSGSASSGFFLTGIQYNGRSAVNGDFVNNFDYWGYFIAGGTAGPDTVEDPADSGIFVPRDASVAGGGTVLPGVFESSNYGASDVAFGNVGRFLEDGAWDVWSFGPFTGAPYTADSALAAAVVPEPSFYAVAAGSLALLVVLRRSQVRSSD